MKTATFLEILSNHAIRLQHLSFRLLRIAIATVLIWIGGLKFFDYEAEGIVPFVANSPFMSFFYATPGDYKGKILKEGEADAVNRQWHEANHTYTFSYGLGILLILMGTAFLFNSFNPVFGMIGSLSVLVMSFVTLSFLVTTPETWVPPLGGPDHGFPYLSGRGRLVIKDIIMMAGALTTLTDSARQYLQKTKSNNKLPHTGIPA